LFTLHYRHSKSKIYVHQLQIQTCTTRGKKKKKTFEWTTIKDFRNLLYSSMQYGMMFATIVFEFTCIWFGLSKFQLSSHLLMFMLSYKVFELNAKLISMSIMIAITIWLMFQSSSTPFCPRSAASQGMYPYFLSFHCFHLKELGGESTLQKHCKCDTILISHFLTLI